MYDVCKELNDLQIQYDKLFDIAKLYQKQIKVAIEALKSYSDDKTYESCYRCQCSYVDGHTAQMALNEINELQNKVERINK
jgi:hypothetical protein